MRFIGDVHGKFKSYNKLIENCEKSIQVGDFGVGFGEIAPEDINHRFIRGNHDDPSVCETMSNWIPDGHIEKTKKGLMMLVGGGFSIDRQWRTEHIDWWRNEELNDYQFGEIYDKYQKVKPQIMITHDLPHSVAYELFGPDGRHIRKTTTSGWLDVFLTAHKPDLWICGHWHETKMKQINGTNFIVLGELVYIDLDL